MRSIILSGLGFLLLNISYAQVITGTDEQAQLPFWEWRSETISIRFVQRLPDQTRAYFSGRGFNKEDVSLIARHCIFQTIFKNISAAQSKQVIDYDLSDWQIHYNNKSIQLKTREHWQPIWRDRKTGQAQKIAFEWSLLPTRQQYKSADYNWGMTVFSLPHGANFDLTVKWKINGMAKKTTLKNMQCAKDINIPPTTE